ncbi:(2Fe-2S)-binding protein [Alicyclobacillus hesperidum subsp. aegles]|nr:(2Fe-2S)-binding protein [Alicyclobacillus hesperidum subsp. aegles]
MSWYRVCHSSDVAVGSVQGFSVNGIEVNLYHLEDGWFATSGICTHQDCSLSDGDIDGNEIVCRCHGGAFDIRTGDATRMPCTIPLETFRVRIHNEFVEIEIDS